MRLDVDFVVSTSMELAHALLLAARLTAWEKGMNFDSGTAPAHRFSSVAANAKTKNWESTRTLPNDPGGIGTAREGINKSTEAFTFPMNCVRESMNYKFVKIRCPVPMRFYLSRLWSGCGDVGAKKAGLYAAFLRSFVCERTREPNNRSLSRYPSAVIWRSLAVKAEKL